MQKLLWQNLSSKISLEISCKKNQSTVAQMAERAPCDRKVPSSNPALDPMRHVSKYNPY